jgi:hypothetical protein
VISFLAKEPSRFDMTCFGRRLLEGTLTDPRILERKDGKGTTLAEALVQMGIDPENILQARLRTGEIKAFIELHTEQNGFLIV